MRGVLAHALGCFGILLAVPAWAQTAPPETIICPEPVPPVAGASCPQLRTISVYDGSLAPAAYSTDRSASLSGNSISVLGDVPDLVLVCGAYNFADFEEVGGNEGNAVFIRGISGLSQILLYGGDSRNGNITNNSVSIAYSEILDDAYIFGGNSYYGNVTGNSLDIADSGISGTYFRGGNSYYGNVAGNSLSIADSEISGTHPYFFGGYSEVGDAMSNSVGIADTKISGNNPYIYGGYSSDGNVSNNSVSIADTKISSNHPYFLGGYSDTGDTTNNSLSIANSEISMDAPYFFGGYSHEGDARNNSLSIADSEILGERHRILGGVSGSGNATNNSVKLSGTLKLGIGSLMSGGNKTMAPPILDCEADKDCFTGNTLSLDNYKRSEVTDFGTVGHFESYEFLLSADSQPLRADTVRFTPANGVPAGAVSAVTSITLAPGYAPAVGTRIPLICACTFEGAIANNGQSLSGSGHTFWLSQGANCIYATVDEIGSGDDSETTDCGSSNAETTGNKAETDPPDKPKKSSGCGCRASGNSSVAELGFVLLWALLARLRRRNMA
ncbi:MAG: hypothetical protein FWD46_01515 [Cystobacterineae bacterium]|nr:hypothetical protein [Cystobacterineae bacterium]